MGALIVVAAAVIRRDDRVLLTRRPLGSHLAGLWEFPGGKLERGESPVACLMRECLEECGIEVEVLEIFEVTHHRYEDREVLLLFYGARIVRGEVQDLQTAGHRWCPLGELDDGLLPPADRGVAAKLRALASPKCRDGLDSDPGSG
ncbi:MAG: (deoxy)nucleoside triphosphate pyrophosphohydrolase [Myxococcales bacterium]|nr:(deoxy)nucleoside triphosphate pyrophosphohydrolase [Myxococcales bacterium]